LEVNDFDFDGHVDAAVPLDYSGGYGSGTYEVLLFDHDAQEFQRSPELSDLTREYMGMFGVDKKRRRLTVVGKSGAAIHYYAVFAVRNRQPILVKKVTETISHDPSCQVTIQTSEPVTTTRTCTRDERLPQQ
jgi:hypothetical protein